LTPLTAHGPWDQLSKRESREGAQHITLDIFDRSAPSIDSSSGRIRKNTPETLRLGCSVVFTFGILFFNIP
jgi:hypothetical protein